MTNEMTSRERMLAAVKLAPVDHIPLGQLFHSTVLGTPDEKKWGNQFERSQIMKDIGLDPVIDIWMPTPEPPEGIQVKKWKEKDPDGPFMLLCAEYGTPCGSLVQKVRQTPDWYSSTHYKFLNAWDGSIHRPKDEFDEIDMLDDWFTRRYKTPLVNGPQDLDKLQYLLKAPKGKKRDEWIKNALTAKQKAREMDLLTQARRVAIGDWFMWICNIEEFCIAMVTEPEYVERFYNIVNDYNKEIVDLVLEVEPDIVQYRGWYDTPDYWGKERHERILVPRIGELAKQVHDGGALFCYLLTEGYTHYHETLSKMDVDVFLGLEPLAARKKEDLSIVKNALKGKSCIWGGVNAHVTVGTGSDEEIGRAVETAMETLGPEGFILNACMYLYDDDVAWDRFLVMVDSWKKHARG